MISSKRSFALRTTHSITRTFSSLPIDYSPEVEAALANQSPILALESTLITHGLPKPHSLTLPLNCHKILRKMMVTPATIALIGGRIKVGLSDDEVEYLVNTAGNGELWKVGRREIATALAQRRDGGTTVSATMAIAQLAGIKCFSTGGIGGVHRGAETSLDISSDLRALSDTPIAVICAGVKSILDIGLTLEYLETSAVAVGAYKTSRWPAFYTPDSGFKAPMTFESVEEIAKIIHYSQEMKLNSGILIGNPIPEKYHQIGLEIQEAVDIAVAELPSSGKRGKEITPWLLQRVNELSKGKSLASNIALIENNVRLGGEIALEYSKLARGNYVSSFQPALPSIPNPPLIVTIKPNSLPTSTPPSPPSIVVIGSVAVDITLRPTASPLLTTSPGSIAIQIGGVAANLARAITTLSPLSKPILIAAIGLDLLGKFAQEGLTELGIKKDLIVVKEFRTASCGLLLDLGGELIGGVADMSITTSLVAKDLVERIGEGTKLVVFDGNLSAEAMAGILKHCQERGIATFFEPTSSTKAISLLKAIESATFDSHSTTSPPLLSYATPNIHELANLYQHISSSESPRYHLSQWSTSLEIHYELLSQRFKAAKWLLAGIIPQSIPLLAFVRTLFVKNGREGLVVITRLEKKERTAWEVLEKRGVKNILLVVSEEGFENAVLIRYFPALVLEGAVGSSTGAGDTLAAVLAARIAKNGGEKFLDPIFLEETIELAQRAAIETLQSSEAVGDLSEIKI